MSGTILENLSGRKLSILVSFLLVSQLICFLIGGLIGEEFLLLLFVCFGFVYIQHFLFPVLLVVSQRPCHHRFKRFSELFAKIRLARTTIRQFSCIREALNPVSKLITMRFLRMASGWQTGSCLSSKCLCHVKERIWTTPDGSKT